MSSFTSCKKVELHLHLEGAASPHFVRDVCKSSGTQIPDIFDKAGNYNWQDFDQFLTIYEIVTNLFLEEIHFEALIRHVLDKQVKENVIYTEIFLGPQLWSDKPSSRWERFLEIASNVADEYKKKWVDPIELTPAFLKLASGKYKHLIGKHVNAWDLSNKDKK